MYWNAEAAKNVEETSFRNFPRNYWKDISNIKKHLKEIIERLGHFPSVTEMEQEYGTLPRAVARFGGPNYFRRVMGFDLRNKERGYWQDLENVVNELEPIINELGRFPTYKEIESRNKRLRNAFRHYRTLLWIKTFVYGEEGPRTPKGFWKDKRKVKDRLDNVIRKLGHFPSYAELKKKDSRLCGGIERHHGSLSEFRKEYGAKETRRKAGFWKDFHNIEDVIQEFINKQGYFPSTTDLSKVDPAINSAIYRHHGNIYRVRIKMGYAYKEMEVIEYLVDDLLNKRS